MTLGTPLRYLTDKNLRYPVCVRLEEASQVFADAYGVLDRFLKDVCNRKRIHPALGYVTSAEFEQ